MNLWDIKELSQYLKIKSSTLYAWAAQGKIPCIKIHRLIRFKPEEIDQWIESLPKEGLKVSPVSPRHKESRDLDTLIARAKQEAYNSRRGGTRPISGPGKGVK